MNNNITWEALSMKDRASFIKLAMQNGYRDLDSIRNLYNTSNKMLASGGPLKESEENTSARVEYIMREGKGTTGKPLNKGTRDAYKASRSKDIPEDRGYFNSGAYTGTVIDHRWNHPSYNPDDRGEYLLLSGEDLYQKFGYKPTDFVDAYAYGDIPFSELGVIEDTDSGEKRLLRNSIDSTMDPPIYQTYPDTLDVKTVQYLDTQLKNGLPNKGDDFMIRNTNSNPEMFRVGESNVGYDGQNVTAVHVMLPDGSIAYKLIDLYDFNPKHWSTSIPNIGKEGLQYLQENGNPYIMSSPWFYNSNWDEGIREMYYSKALGGPLYNEDNPIEAFQGNPYIPVVRYENGGEIYIKPSKRGTFTAAAKKRNMGVQEFASKVLANKENYSSAMVKKANFAKNAKKWKH